MSITFGTPTIGKNSGSSPLSFAHEVVAGTSALIVAVSYGGSGNAISSVTFNSLSLIPVIASTPNAHASFYILVSPPVGTYNIIVTKSAATDRGTIVAAVNSFGSDLVSPVGSSDFDSTGSNFIISTTITTSALNSAILVLATKRPNGGDTISPDINLIPLSNEDQAGSTEGCRSGFSYRLVSAIDDYSVSYFSSGSNEWGIVAFELLAASAPPVYYVISGEVTLSGTPVEGAIIRCIKQSDNTTVAYQESDINGLYEFEDLEEGELYHLCVEYQDESQKYYGLSYWDIEPVEVEV